MENKIYVGFISGPFGIKGEVKIISKLDHLNNIFKVGNNLIITTDYQTSVTAVKNALNDKRLTESQIDNLTLRVIEWKYYKGLLYENQK